MTDYGEMAALLGLATGDAQAAIRNHIWNGSF